MLEEVVLGPTDITNLERPQTGGSNRFVKSVRSVANFRTIQVDEKIDRVTKGVEEEDEATEEQRDQVEELVRSRL
jgi:hypothetical protein